MTAKPNEAANLPGEPFLLGVSSCLLGARVRFDGQHKRDPFVVDLLGPYVQWKSICPEVEIGLGTPRESLRLVGDVDNPSLIANKSATDLTDTMNAYAKKKIDALRKFPLRGFILKKDSPSCGMERVRVYSNNGMPARQGRGLFAAKLIDGFPMLPIEEEGRLHDPLLRENFIERIFAYDRWLRLNEGRLTPRKLVDFHTGEKLAVMSHSTVLYRELGQIIAKAGTEPIGELAERYGLKWMETLKTKASRRKHANTLQHVQGYFKKNLDEGDKQELNDVISQYRLGRVPLSVPLTLLKHHLRRHPDPWLEKQRYLQPYPDEMMLRNSV